MVNCELIKATGCLFDTDSLFFFFSCIKTINEKKNIYIIVRVKKQSYVNIDIQYRQVNINFQELIIYSQLINVIRLEVFKNKFKDI